MATGAIVAAWQTTTDTHIAVAVQEDPGDPALTEYVASVPTLELAGLTALERRSRLRDAVKAVRDGQRVSRAVVDITGTVTV